MDNTTLVPFLRNFFIRPILPRVLEVNFQTGQVVQGRIIDTFPKQNSFILNMNGLNLVARSHLSLFKGDNIVANVLKNKPQIELKLIEVNGQSMNHNMRISGEEINYVSVPLPEGQFGSKSYLEIYPDKNGKPKKESEEASESIRLIVNSPLLRHLVIELAHSNRQLTGKVMAEDVSLYEFLSEKKREIQISLQDENIEQADIDFLTLPGTIGMIREKWTNPGRLDVRA